MGWIKICGITSVETADIVVRAKADAVGLNFYSGSKRCIDLEIAARVVQAVGEQIDVVGLFVNHSMDEVVRTLEATQIRTVQLHGDESPEFCAALRSQLPGVTLMRAVRPESDPVGEVSRELTVLAEFNCGIDRLLVDARVKDAYGGTGHTADWNALRLELRPDSWPPFVLAGGLNPGNVADAISLVRPDGVDVASGVERDGQIDADLAQEFAANARDAFSLLR